MPAGKTHPHPAFPPHARFKRNPINYFLQKAPHPALNPPNCPRSATQRLTPPLSGDSLAPVKAVIAPVSALLLATAATGSGAIIFDDTFADGGRTNGADAADIGWTTGGAGSGAISVVNDTTFGSNSLRVAPGGTFQSILGSVPTVTTLNPGQTLTLTVRFRYESALSGGNLNANGALRIGLYSNNGLEALADTTSTTAVGSGASLPGYYANLRSGPADSTTGAGTGHEIYRETENNNAIMAGNRNSITNTRLTPPGISDSAGHTIVLELVRVGDTITFRALLDGVLLSTGSHTDSVGAPLITGFDTIAISSGGTQAAFLIDQATLELIPEPSTALLGMLGAVSFLGIRRRK